MEQEMRIRTFILLWVLFLGASSIHAQPCLPEGIMFTTQSQIDSFPILYPNCTQIEGNVRIDGPSIKNLNELIVITSIGGDLFIDDNNNLISFTGLENLKSIGGSLSFTSFPFVTCLPYFEGISAADIL